MRGVARYPKGATKSQSEWEDEKMDEVHGKATPPVKPPRHDLRNHRINEDYDDRNEKEREYRREKAAKDHRPGDVWRTDRGWRAMSPSGDSKTFDSKEDAKEYATADRPSKEEPDIADFLDTIPDDDLEDLLTESLPDEQEPEEDLEDLSDFIESISEEDLESLLTDTLDETEDAGDETSDETEDAGDADTEESSPEDDERAQKAMDALEASLQTALSPKAGMPASIRDKIHKVLGKYKGKDRRTMIRSFEKALGTYLKKNAFTEWSRTMVNRAGEFEDYEGLEDPKDVGRKLAQVAYGYNVVANPKILGGKPVSSKPKSQEELSSRALESFHHYMNLNDDMREHAAKVIQDEIKGLKPNSPKAQELESILTGMATAHIIKTGKSLPGRPEPAQSAVALIRKMHEQGQPELLFKPVEDFFSTQARDSFQQALSSVSPKEMVEMTVGDDRDHPYAKLAQKLIDEEIPEPFAQGIRSFLEQEYLQGVTWRDRVFRDALSSVGRDTDAETRFKELQAATKEPAPEVLDFLDAVEKEAADEPLSPHDQKTLQEVETSKGDSLVRSSARKFVDWVSKAFDKPFRSGPLSVMRKYVDTGDRAWLERPVSPHPDRRKTASKRFCTYIYEGSRGSRGPNGSHELHGRSIQAMAKINKQAAFSFTGQVDRIASIVQKNYASLGISKKFAQDFVVMCDRMSDHIDQQAGIDRQAMMEQEIRRRQAAARRQAKSKRQAQVASPDESDGNFTLTDLGPNDWDPSEIGEEYSGAFLRDADEPYMDTFQQDEFHQLGEVVEDDLFSNENPPRNRPTVLR